MSKREAVIQLGKGKARIYMRIIPLFLVSFFTGLGMVFYFGVGVSPALTGLSAEISLWATILATFAFIYGFTSLVVLHTLRLYRMKDSRVNLYSSGVLLGTFIFVIALILSNPLRVSGPAIVLFTLYILAYIGSGVGFTWVFHPFITYRTFKLTSINAVVMFSAFLIYMLRQMPMMGVLWPPIIAIGEWIGYIPQNAALRAATACIGISSVMLGLRALAGKEPSLIELEV